MEIKNLFIDFRKCTGCRECETACRAENDLPPEYNWINVIQVGPRKVEGKVKTEYVPIFCRNCEPAPCITACPRKAITRMSNGNILINPDLCIGCMSCAEVCPFGAIAFDSLKRAATLCTLCQHLTEAGEAPACVQACPSNCIYYGDSNKMMDKIRNQAISQLVEEASGNREYG